MNARHNDSLDLRTIGLRVFLTLLAVNALLGMIVVLGGDMGEGGWKVLGTSLLLTLGVMLGLACVAGRDSKGFAGVWRLGVALAAVGTAVWIVSIWSEFEAEEPFQLAGSLTVAASAVACASILSLATLPPTWRRVQLAAYVVVGLLALAIIIAIWAGADDGGLWQVIAILAIAFAALAIAIPVLHRAGSRTSPAATNIASHVSYCPRCAAAVTATADTTATCGQCGAVFRVHYDAP